MGAIRNKKTSAIFMASLFLTSAIAVFVLFTPPVSAGGTIYIDSDYTFTSDIYEPIVVVGDNIVIDGAGHTLQGIGDGVGISLDGRYNVTIKNVRITGFGHSIHLDHNSNYNVIEGNNASYNFVGISLPSSSSNIIINNIASHNSHTGILLGDDCSNNVVINNVASYNQWGVRIGGRSCGNVINGNTLVGNTNGITMHSRSDNNLVYHNNFVNNAVQASSMDSINVWDDGYPSGGNYWSDYNGVDTDGDGIGNTPYIIDDYNQDNFPLMEPWSVPTMIKSLIRAVVYWELAGGTERCLTSKLEDTIHLLDSGNENGAIHKLMDFMNQVEAMRYRKLTNPQADYLISEAQRIIDLINE